jgi:hypothetical protein
MPIRHDALELEVVEMALIKCVQDVQRSVSFEKLLTVTIKNMSDFIDIVTIITTTNIFSIKNGNEKLKNACNY